MHDIGYYLGLEPLGALAIVLSTAMLYGAFALILTHFGQRLYAVPSSLELAVVTVLGAIVGRAILGQVPTLSGGLLALATLFLLERAAGRVRRSERMQARRRYRAVALMVHGTIDRGELRRRGLDDSTLWSALRRTGISDPAQVALAVLERDGSISVIRAGTPLHPAVLTGVRHAQDVRPQLGPVKGEEPGQAS